jgi:hypothetical protein
MRAGPRESVPVDAREVQPQAPFLLQLGRPSPVSLCDMLTSGSRQREGRGLACLQFRNFVAKCSNILALLEIPGRGQPKGLFCNYYRNTLESA